MHVVVHQPPSRKIGSIADYDPLNDNYGSLATGYRQVHPQDISNMNMYRGMFTRLKKILKRNN